MSKGYSRKCRLCRGSGEKLFLKGERCFSSLCPIDKRGVVPPGQHGAKGRRKISDYRVRLQEKQKLKRLYGVDERQMKRYSAEARRARSATGERILQILESRLDNLVYRLGFAPSRRLAHQLVGHRHILVDGKIVNIPSYRAKAGQVINLDSKSLGMALVKSMLEKKEYTLPAWLERKAAVGRLVRLPKREEIDTDVNEQLIVEYYSR